MPQTKEILRINKITEFNKNRNFAYNKIVVENFEMTREQHSEALNYLEEQYGSIIRRWDEGRLQTEIKNYWKDRQNETNF
jgi:cellulose biosynthesis protein BcsQ